MAMQLKIGSATRCYIALFVRRDNDDPLLFQLKEAEASVLEAYLPKSKYQHHGHRVVDEQRGWSGFLCAAVARHEALGASGAVTPPRVVAVRADLRVDVSAHARSGDRIAIASYLGGSAKLDEAIADFAERYAEQTERDHVALAAAVKSGRITPETGIRGQGAQDP